MQLFLISLMMFIAGNLALAFDRQIADAMNRFGAEFEHLTRHLRQPGWVTPGSHESYENILFSTRWWGVTTILLGIVSALPLFLRR